MRYYLLAGVVFTFAFNQARAQFVPSDSMNLGEDRVSHNYQEFGSSISVGNYECSGDSSITVGANSQDDSIVFELNVLPNTDEVMISWNYSWFNSGPTEDLFTKIVVENAFEEDMISPGPNAIGSHPISCNLDSHRLTFSGLASHTADGKIKVKIYDPYPGFTGNSSICKIIVYSDTPPTPNGVSTDRFASRVSVFPNPTNRSVFIDIRNPQGASYVRLYSTTGQLLQMQAFNEASHVQFDIDQPSGVYFLSFQSGVHREMVKVIKE